MRIPKDRYIPNDLAHRPDIVPGTKEHADGVGELIRASAAELALSLEELRQRQREIDHLGKNICSTKPVNQSTNQE